MPSETPTEAPARRRRAAAAVCPYCSLLCDDVVLVPSADGSVRVTRNGCRRAATDFARLPTPFQPRIAGRKASLEDACSAAAALLRRARQPLIGGLATDVDGTRAAVRLAERCGATLDHVHGDSLAAMTTLLQSRGWYTTTLSELRNRADFVLLAGVDLSDRYENFARRCLAPKAGLHPDRLARRRVVALGTPTDAATTSIACGSDALAPALTALLALLRGARLDAAGAGGVPIPDLQAVADEMRAARYCVIAFAPGQMSFGREPALGAVFDIIDELNRDGRAAGLPLGGDDGGQTAAGTCAWMTGHPLRVRFGKTLAYDPIGNTTAKLLDNGAADALLWIDAFGRHPNPPRGANAAGTIVLGAVSTAAAKRAAVYIPVGTPGVDHAGRLLRTDSAVTLPLAGLREHGLPDVASVLRRVSAAL